MAFLESNRDSFLKWFKEQPAFREQAPFAEHEVDILCDKIEKYCDEKKLSNTRFFETVDFEQLESIKNYIEANKLFRLSHFMSFRKIARILDFYLRFIQCRQSEIVIALDGPENLVEDDVEESVVDEYDECNGDILIPILECDSGENTSVSDDVLIEEDYLIQQLKSRGLEYRDDRKSGKYLWVFDCPDAKAFAADMEKLGILLHLRIHGGSATDGRSAWWTRRAVQDIEQLKDVLTGVGVTEPSEPEDSDNSTTAQSSGDMMSDMESKQELYRYLAGIFAYIRDAAIQEKNSTLVDLRQKLVLILANQCKLREKNETNDSEDVPNMNGDQNLIADRTQATEVMGIKEDVSEIDDDDSVILLADVDTLADQLYRTLKKTTKDNPYGTTSTYLSRCVHAPIAEVETILKEADWAVKEYQRYEFCGSEDNMEMEIDFTKTPSLAFTKPVSVNYFDEICIQVSSWRQLLLKLMECLHEDYPDIIGMPSAHNLSSIVVDSEHKHLLRAPGKIAENTWVELNRSSTEIINLIKRVLEECNVDYENIKITYIRLDDNEVCPSALEARVSSEINTGIGCTTAQTRETSAAKIHSTERRNEDSQDVASVTMKDSFKKWMTGKKHLSDATAASYSSAVTNCEQILRNIGVTDSRLYGCDSSESKRRIGILMNTTPFYEANRTQHNRLKSALNKYVAFLEETSLEKPEEKSISNHTHADESLVYETPTQQLSEIDQLLSDNLYLPLRKELYKHNITSLQQLENIKLWAFMNQYNLYSIATRQTVLVNVRQLLTSSSDIDEGKLFKINIDNSVFSGKSCAEAFMHFCENIANKYPLRIRNLIGKRADSKNCIVLSRNDIYPASLKMENPTIYINAELSVDDVMSYIEWICSMCAEAYTEIAIDEPVVHTPATTPSNSEKPDPLPLPEMPERLEQEKPSSSTTCIEPIVDDSSVEKLLLQADIDGMSYADLQEELNWTMIAIRNYVAKCNRIVEIKNRLFHEDAFIDWDEGAEQLDGIIEKLMQKNNGYVSAAQLYEFARVEMNMFLNDNDLNDERSVYEMAQHLYEKENYQGKHYTFTGKMHISKTSDAIENTFDVFCKFADEQGGMFRYEDLKEYLEQVGIKTGNLRMQLKVYTQPDFLYYEEGVLLSSKSIKITQAWKNQVKQALQRLFDDVGDHIIIREIMPFWFDQLPDLPGGKPWTPMLLQSVLRFYSEELGAHTIIAMESQSIETVHTMLVANDSDIQNFGDVVIAYLRENNIEQKKFEAEELRALLVESKMIQGNELIWNMPKALQKDERFAWDASNKNVTIRV